MQNSEIFKSLIWGIHPIEEALQEAKPFNKILLNKDLQQEKFATILDLARQRKVIIQKVPIEKLNRLTQRNHQGIVGMMSPVTFYSIEQIIPGIFEQAKTPLVLVLDGVTDMRNFGAIIRSAAAFNVDAIVVPEKDSAPVTADTIKTSAGNIFKIKICREYSLKKAVNFLKLSGLQIIAASEKAEKKIKDIDFHLPTAIVLGAEDKGISQPLLSLIDVHTKIPIAAGVNSLNVSVASAIFLYESRRFDDT